MAGGATSAAVLGGSVSGLAAAQGLVDGEAVTDVTVFERQTYDDKRVDCGEAINDARLVPLAKTPDNGFLNEVSGFQLRVYAGTDRAPSEPPLCVSDLACEHGYICQRDVVERRWAETLAAAGVEFRTDESVSPADYRSIVDAYDYVIDATGQPALTLKARDETDRYAGHTVALNATVAGDFAAYADRPRVFFEGYVGYAWAFPKSETRANVGIGWAGEDRPDDYLDALAGAAARNGFPMPDREDVNVYTIPRGPSLAPQHVARPDEGVFLVGDAAGVANRYQGEGICQGIRSSYLLCDLIERGEAEAYPRRLYERMKPECRLAHLMRGAWVEHRDPGLLAAVAEAIEGLTIDEITREPRTVARRLARRPLIAARLFADRGMLGRVRDAYTDSWAVDGDVPAREA